MGIKGRLLASAIMCVALALVPSCASTPTVDKAGGGAHIVLRLANANSNLEYTPAVQAFVDSVARLSGGELQIDVVDDWGGNPPDPEQQVVAAVRAGEADLGWVGTRVFDILGVTAFTPLTAPLLIDSYALEQAVLESDLPATMLSSLGRLGVSGVALMAGGLRKPVAATAPVVSSADWVGITFQSFPSNGQFEAIRTLGATPTDVLWDQLDIDIHNGDVRGFEKGLRTVRINSQFLIAPYITANVNLWPETIALFANPASLSRLSEEERSWITQAAAESTADSAGMFDDQHELETLCDEGSEATDASATDLESLRAALAPLLESMRDGPEAGSVLRIERLKAQTRAEPSLVIPSGCLWAGSTG